MPVMPNYIRPRRAGATVFFTVCLARQGSALLIDHVDLLREAVAHTRDLRPFGIDAWVVLPDHMHTVWTLPCDDANYSQRWGMIKARFSRHLRILARVGKAREVAVGWKPTLRQEAGAGTELLEVERLRAERSPSKVAKKDAGIWQRRFWEHHVRGPAEHAEILRYCHVDPVTHGLVARPEDWVCSSIHREIREGRWVA